MNNEVSHGHSEKTLKYIHYISELCKIDCRESGCIDGFCRSCCYERCKPESTDMFGCSEANRWGGKYIYYCPLGLAFIAASLTPKEKGVCRGIIAGPMLIGETDDTVDSIPDKRFTEKVSRLRKFHASRVTALSEIMAGLAESINGRPHNSANYDQENLLKMLYEVKDTDSAGHYSMSRQMIDKEKEIRDSVLSKDRVRFTTLLNEILGNIYFSCDFDLEKIRIRIVELTVVLSRASIDAGAQLNEILQINAGNIKSLMSYTDIEELSERATEIMNGYVRYIFDYAQIRHVNVVYRAMEYIREHYAEKITLEMLAEKVYLSRTYLSRIFKDETSVSLTTYINNIRVERSKVLLAETATPIAEVAGLCGFEDQSYFTRVFKSVTGISPKKYRDGASYG